MTPTTTFPRSSWRVQLLPSAESLSLRSTFHLCFGGGSVGPKQGKCMRREGLCGATDAQRDRC